MLKIIRRVLRLSGNLSKRIWGSFICGFLESMFGLLPIAAVFLVLIELQNGQPITGQTWGIVIGLIAGGLILRMIFKYLVYRLQSTAGFEFVARERIALGDRLRNVPMGFPSQSTATCRKKERRSLQSGRKSNPKQLRPHWNTCKVFPL